MVSVSKTPKDHTRPRIPGMALVAERPHNKHGMSVFRDGLKMNNISVCEEGNVELITVELSGVIVHYMYKPPSIFQQSQYTLGIHHNKQRRIICGEMDSNSLSLILNAKLPKSFNSAIWKKGYNPDLIFVSSIISENALYYQL